AGIIAEYNPFHNGHASHLERTRLSPETGASHIVAVMSGNFTQRGEPALAPKADRVAAAMACGIDLVLELPLPWAMASAERFAAGAVVILDGLRCVELLSFGSECGDAALLERAAEVMLREDFLHMMRYRMENGVSYADAQQKALAETGGQRLAALLDSPNNTLGIEYIKALLRRSSPIRPFTVPRLGAAHDAVSPVGGIASASYIRRLAQEKSWLNAAAYLPGAAYTVFSEALGAGRLLTARTLADRAVLAALRRMGKAELSAVPGISEGLENRLYNAVRTARSLSELEQAIKTKRYPMTRIRRLIWSAYLGIPNNLESPPYIRILGCNQRGEEILAAAKAAKTALPLLARASQTANLTGDAKTVWDLECRAADLYGLCLPEPMDCGSEQRGQVVN
ncbi:MAG: nucleotidyltransferase family protein, partial [Oscillospiraceae bacterium]|nr:nucleotidyltransferase family protein [Oscillospiraceae bacterium]